MNKCRYIVLAATIGEDNSLTPVAIFFENLVLLFGMNIRGCYLIKISKMQKQLQTQRKRERERERVREMMPLLG